MWAGSSGRPTSVDCYRLPTDAAWLITDREAGPTCASSSPGRRPRPSRRCRPCWTRPHEVVAVISRPDAPAGSGPESEPSPVAALAREAGIELLTPATASAPEFVSALTELAPDAAAVVAYGAILRQNVLDIPANGWVNLHFSLLPAWRGAAPVQAAIRAGDDITGATTFRLEAGLDTGPVYGVVTETDLAHRHGRHAAGPARRLRGRSCWSPPWTGSQTARSRPSRSRPTASAWPARSPWRTRRSTGRCRRRRSTG